MTDPAPGLRRAYRLARRAVIAVVGFTLLALGLVLLVTPGPASLVIPAGLGLLALEFAWARRLLGRLRRRLDRWRETRHGDPDPR